METLNRAANKEHTKILVIDDEQGLRDLLSFELRSQGYTVITASNGEEGLEKVKNEKFQLVISDIKMPKMDGIQALDAIKKVDSDIEVIMATGYGTIETAIASMKKGAYDFVQKPFNLDEIMNLVEKALEKAELKVLVALYESSKAIFSTVKLDDLLPILVSLSSKLLKADDVSIILIGEDKKLYIAASEGLDDEVKKKTRLSLGKGVVGKVAEWKEPVMINGPLKEDPRFSDLESKEGIQSSIICPLLSKTELLGVMCIARTTSKIFFSDSDLRHANIFLSQIVQAVDNARLYQELEKKVEALKQAYSELSEMKDELVQSEKLTAIGELASGAAHELNNPLTTVIALVDLMLENEDDSSKERVEDLKTVREEAHRCRKIIQNLLQFSRKQKSDKKQAHVNDLVEKTLDLVEYDLKSSTIQIRKEFDHTIPPIAVQPTKIRQVFLNIINNARHALAHSSQPELIIRTLNLKDKVEIHFIDNGCGISNDIINKIFNPFFTTKEVGKGTGLGLSISYGIVKDHLGRIYVKSEEGKGTKFCIELPIPTPK